MRRSLALLVLCATSWSYVAALRCEMGAAGPTSTTHGHASHADAHAHDPAAHTAVHGHAVAPDGGAGETAPAPARHGHPETDGDRCLMTMTCGAVTSAPAPGPTVNRAPISAKRLVPASSTAPGASSPALEPPPPRTSA